MNPRLVTWTGAGLITIGGLVAIIFFLQPWRSCPYEDTAAGCAMLSRDAAVMTIGFLVALTGTAVLLVNAGQNWRADSRPS